MSLRDHRSDKTLFHQINSNCCMVFFLVFLHIFLTKRTNGVASRWSQYKNQNLSHQGKFQGNVDQGKGNFDQASQELSEFEFPGCTVVVFLYFPYAFHDYNAKNKS